MNWEAMLGFTEPRIGIPMMFAAFFTWAFEPFWVPLLKKSRKVR